VADSFQNEFRPAADAVFSNIVDHARAQITGVVTTQFQPFVNVFKDTTVDQFAMAPVGKKGKLPERAPVDLSEM
jgi:hypothetical protein